MPKFVEINSGDKTIFVNPDRVRYVISGTDRSQSRVFFDNEQSLLVPDDARNIARLFEKADD